MQSPYGQTTPPDEVIVVADNGTDDTEQGARRHAAEVFVTVDNPHKKAGALNQVRGAVLPALQPDDVVLVMGADSLLHSTFLQTAHDHLGSGSDLGGVGGTFEGGPGGGMLGTFQRNEYARYARDVRRLKSRALVLTGTASVFPVRVLRHVQQARHDRLVPDRSEACRSTTCTCSPRTTSSRSRSCASATASSRPRAARWRPRS